MTILSDRFAHEGQEFVADLSNKLSMNKRLLWIDQLFGDTCNKIQEKLMLAEYISLTQIVQQMKSAKKVNSCAGENGVAEASVFNKFFFTDDDTKNLEHLLDVFGSVVSLNYIAATYGKAYQNPTIAGDILVEFQAGTYGTTTSASEEKPEDSLTLTSKSDLRSRGSCDIDS
ncbi:hypothetical protein K7X08_026985 [Anisodus acutangulus]|uniref:Uncharacterized protein n=1 Tax=Anisodus acutangulus TaxID=402998 RepID=A0A9Q1QXY9_9SOLA|nr:hypothetical protein K7X08_026985 [Anisodus acutangulus]